MIDLSEVITDPDFAQNFTLKRTTGNGYRLGVWTPGATTTVPLYGIIQPSPGADLDMVPEGDRMKGYISVWSVSPITLTHSLGPSDPNAATSDVITYRGDDYRVAHDFGWQDFGYYKVMAVRMRGE